MFLNTLMHLVCVLCEKLGLCQTTGVLLLHLSSGTDSNVQEMFERETFLLLYIYSTADTKISSHSLCDRNC